MRNKYPSDWNNVLIGESTNIFGGYAFKSSKFTTEYSEEKYQVLRMSNVQMGNLLLSKAPVFLDRDGISERENKYILSKGDVLITLTGTMNKRDYGNVVLVDEDDRYLLNQRVACLRAADSSTIGEYYYYYLQTKEFRDEFFKFGLGGTGNQANVSINDLKGISLIYPPLMEQKKIAKILSTVDDHIDEVDGMIDDLKELKKGLMQKLLTEGIGHTEFKDSVVGKIPVEWSVVKQGDISTFYNGRAYKRHEFRDDGTPIVRIQNLTGEGNFVYSDLELDENKYISIDDLIYAWSATFGPFIWKGDRAIYHYHIWKIECSSLIDKMFYYYRLNFISNELDHQKNGSAFVHITKGFMEKHEIALPPLSEQKKIADILFSIDERIDAYRDELNDLHEVKKGLIQGLLTGKVRVSI